MKKAELAGVALAKAIALLTDLFYQVDTRAEGIEMIVTRVPAEVWKNLPLIIRERYFFKAIGFKFWEFVAWLFPRRLLVHAVIRAWIETTSPPYSFDKPGTEGEFTQIITTLERLASIDEGWK